MSMKLLGPHFDIHGGGLDLVFPHHENEVVQSESFTGETFASYWLHNGLLTKDGKKISKSDPGTVVLMVDLLNAHDPGHFSARPLPRQPLPPADRLRPDPARRAEARPANLLQGVREVRAPHRAPLRRVSTSAHPPRPTSTPAAPRLLQEVAEHRERFLDAMDDDFNTGGALGELFEVAHALNRAANTLTPEDAAGVESYGRGMVVLKELSQLLGLFRARFARTCPSPTHDGLFTPALLDLAGRAADPGPQGQELHPLRRDPAAARRSRRRPRRPPRTGPSGRSSREG